VFQIILFTSIAIMVFVLVIFVWKSERNAENTEKALDFVSVAMTNLAAIFAGGGLYYRFRHSERFYFSASLLFLGIAFAVYTCAHLRKKVMAPLAADILMLIVFSTLLWSPFRRFAEAWKKCASIVAFAFGAVGFFAVGYIFYYFEHDCEIYPYCLSTTDEDHKNQGGH
jgi:hypothetical protein